MSRCPRNLRQLVSSYRHDEEFLTEKFDVLRALARDDRQEADMLRSRVDQQSELIAILKQRSDQYDEEYERALNHVAELENAKEALAIEASKERKQREIIEQRFKDLNENHVQMISIKDEYKAEIDIVKKDNERLKRENTSLFNEIVQQKDSQIVELHSQLTDAMERCRQLEEKRNEVERKAATRATELEKKIKDAELELADTKKSLKEKSKRDDESSQQYQEQLERNNIVIRQLEKDRDHVTSLAMERGKAIEEYQQKVIRLEDETQTLRKKLESSEERFQTESNRVSKDARIRELTQRVTDSEKKLEEMKRMYEAYKQHSSKLLANEKKLNATLRHLTL